MISFKIRGTVRDAQSGAGLAGVTVRAVDKDRRFEELLGSAETRNDGSFELVVEPRNLWELLEEFFELRPDLYLEVLSRDGTLLHATDPIRFRPWPIGSFDIRIPHERLVGVGGVPSVHVFDDGGERRETVDVGESLGIRLTGLRPRALHTVVLLDDGGAPIATSDVIADAYGTVAPSALFPQLLLHDPRTDEKFTVEDAQARWRGRMLTFEVRRQDGVVARETVKVAQSFTRPLLLSTDERGVLLNGFVAGERDAVVSVHNVLAGDARVFMVPRQHDWYPGDSFAPVALAGGRPAFADVTIASGTPARVRIAAAAELQPGTYDFIVRQLRYGYEDDEDLVLRASDLVTRRVTGLVVREEFMRSKTVFGGCANYLKMAGRSISGPPYYQYLDTFQVGDDVYAALDPAALDPNHKGKMLALYVVAHKDAAGWNADHSLTNLAVLGGNAAVPKFLTQTDCINHNARLVWPNASQPGLYDIAADFGNNTANAMAFVTDASYDNPLDIMDGYFKPGFQVINDPTTETSFANVGAFSYDETTEGSSNVTDDYGNPWIVPRRANVRFPADAPGATAPAQISVAQPNYPLIVIVHGNGHNYQGYDYLLDHWAANGFIAASINLTGGMTGTDRAMVLFDHLTILKRNDPPGPNQHGFGTKVQNNIGIMGHSRGGEAVVIAARRNQQMALGHAINAVISLSPTDQYTHETLGPPWATPYLVIYGAMDGDLAGGDGPPSDTGFPLYDRANGARKGFVMVYGATHDRFTTIGPDTDLNWKRGAADYPLILTEPTHQTVAKGYMTAFFRWQLRNEAQFIGMFRGEWVPTAIALAEPSKLKILPQYSDLGAHNVDDFEGPHTPTSWQTATDGSTVSDGGTLPAPPQEDLLYNLDVHSPHDTSGLQLHWNALGERLTYTFPAPLDVHAFAALSFRVTQKADSMSNPPGAPQDFYLTLHDGGGKQRAIRASKFAEIAAPQPRALDQYTKSALRTVRIPLDAYRIEVIGTQKVDLTQVTSLDFFFNYNASGEIEIDSIEFTP
jgi:Chlorophyllase enzyme